MHAVIWRCTTLHQDVVSMSLCEGGTEIFDLVVCLSEFEGGFIHVFCSHSHLLLPGVQSMVQKTLVLVALPRMSSCLDIVCGSQWLSSDSVSWNQLSGNVVVFLPQSSLVLSEGDCMTPSLIRLSYRPSATSRSPPVWSVLVYKDNFFISQLLPSPASVKLRALYVSWRSILLSLYGIHHWPLREYCSQTFPIGLPLVMKAPRYTSLSLLNFVNNSYWLPQIPRSQSWPLQTTVTSSFFSAHPSIPTSSRSVHNGIDYMDRHGSSPWLKLS